MVRVGVVGCGVGVRGGGSGVVKLDAGAGGTSGDRDLAEAFLGLGLLCCVVLNFAGGDLKFVL